MSSDNTPLGEWRLITWETIPSREELEQETIELAEKGVLNSVAMRSRILRGRKLYTHKASTPNTDPSSKFVNEHAFVLNYLKQGGVLIPIASDPHSTTYRLDSETLARWRALDTETLARLRTG